VNLSGRVGMSGRSLLGAVRRVESAAGWAMADAGTPNRRLMLSTRLTSKARDIYDSEKTVDR
jgi:hypothetical protein